MMKLEKRTAAVKGSVTGKLQRILRRSGGLLLAAGLAVVGPASSYGSDFTSSGPAADAQAVDAGSALPADESPEFMSFDSLTADSDAPAGDLNGGVPQFEDGEVETSVFAAGDPDQDGTGTAAEEDDLSEEELTALAPFETTSWLMEVPEPSGSEFDNSLMADVGSAELPAVFDNRAFVTPAKNQNPYGMCWSFSTISGIETSLLLQQKGIWDFSEEHLAYFFSHRTNDPLGNTDGDYNRITRTGGEYAYREGGNQIMAALHLSEWSGLVQEPVVPYPTDETHTQVLPCNPDPKLAYQHEAVMTEAAFATKADMVRLKTMIRDYGSVGVSLYWVPSLYYDGSTFAYSVPASAADENTGSFPINHAVTLVGWDDTYPADNFKSRCKVTENGAWIVKNSYGPSFGDDGFFYISYECASLRNAVSVAGSLETPYENNYFYDGSASLLEYYTLKPAQGGESSSIGNIFQVKAGSGRAEALGEVVLADYSAAASYEIQVYTNLTDAADPTSGTPAFASPVKASFVFAGVHTVALPRPVILTQNSLFSVVVSNVGTSDARYLLDVSGSNTSWVTFETASHAGQSFAKDGTGWVDLASRGKCARIKAHTHTLDTPVSLTLSQTEAELTQGDTLSLQAVLTDPGTVFPSYSFKNHLAFRSTDRTVAVVNEENGLITARKKGTAVIEVRVLGTDLTASCTVRVKLLPAPGKVSADGKSYKKVQVTWDPVPGASGYAVWRRINASGQPWVRLAYAEGKTNYDDNSVKLGVTYRYKIRPYVTLDGTKLGGTVSAVVKGAPLLPASSSLNARSLSRGRVTLIWTPVSGATGYVIYRRTPGGSYKKVARVYAPTLTWTDQNLRSGTSWQYRIRAYRKVDGKNLYGKYRAGKAVTVR